MSSESLTALPNIGAFRSAREVGGSAAVPHAVPPSIDATSRNITSIHDARHTVAQMSNCAPTFTTRGEMHAPGKATGLRITSERAGSLSGTSSGAALDAFGASPSRHRTRTELLAARRDAQRAPASYDLDGDATVSQREFFYATKFDTNGDGDLSQAEREEASRLMKSEASKLIFLSTGGLGPVRGNFSRYSPAVVSGHRVVQQHGAIMSEQLEGYAALTRSRLAGGGGPAAALHGYGDHLPPDIAQKVGETLLVGNAGAQRGAGVDVDVDTSDNVVAYHMDGAENDYDRVQVKLGYRKERYASGSKLLSELKARRKAENKPDLTYDADGDGAVSNRDYFFSSRQDRKGMHTLTTDQRTAAALEEQGKGLGSVFVHLRGGGGAGQAGHRVMQSDGVVVGEDVAGGWNNLALARADGSTIKAGADGNLHMEAGASADAEVTSGVGELGPDGLTDDGRIRMEIVKGAVTDYDTVTVKPSYRPELAASGSRTVREYLLHRRRDKRPDPSFDLSGAGCVSDADYQLAKRFDKGDKGYLTSEEQAVAHAALADGLRDKFARLSTGAGANTATRTVQKNGVVTSDEGTLLGGGVDDDGDETNDTLYERSKRLPSMGAVPGLDMPASVSRGDIALGGRANVTGASGSLAGTYVSTLKQRPVGPYVTQSMGAVPGVTRAIVHYPDGRQEAYGGYAGGIGAGGVTNVTAMKPALSPETKGVEMEGSTRGELSRTREMESTASIDFNSEVPPRSQRTLRPEPNLYPEAPFRTHNQTTYTDYDAPNAVHLQAPFALMGVGGSGDGMAGDLAMQAQRETAHNLSLRTRRQLVAARRLRGAAEAESSALSGAAGAASIPAASLLFSNSLTGTMAASWAANNGAVAGAAQLAAKVGTLSPRAPDFGSTTQDRVEAATHLPTGLPATLDRTGRGEYAGGLSGLDTTAALASMPPQFNMHGENAAAMAALVTSRAPGSPLAPGAAAESARLPAYLARSLKTAKQIPVEPSELATETVKPGALDETVRTLEATTRSALLAARVRDAKSDAMADAADGSLGLLAEPELYPAHFNDHLSHGKPLVTLGQEQLSKTRTQLSMKRRGQRIAEALPDAPGENSGIHAAPLPKFADKTKDGVPWYRDTAARDAPTSRRGPGGFAFSDVVSPLDGPAPPEDPIVAALPDNLHGIDPKYDAATRHTVRRVDAAGTVLGADLLRTVSRVDLAPGQIGAKSPRLLADGLRREEEAVDAAAGDVFKIRSVAHSQLGSWHRRHGEVTGKVTSFDPSAGGDVDDGSVAAGGAGTAFLQRSPGEVPIADLHRNMSTAVTCLPGAPALRDTRALRESMLNSPFRERGYTSAILGHNSRVEAINAETVADDGKERYTNPKDHAPLFSSFSSDRIFQSNFTIPRGIAKPQSPNRNALAAAASNAGGSSPIGHAGAPRMPVFVALPAGGVPGPGSHRSPLKPTPGDAEARRGSVYGTAFFESAEAASAASASAKPLPAAQPKFTPIKARESTPLRTLGVQPARLVNSAGGAGFVEPPASGAVRTRGFLK